MPTEDAKYPELDKTFGNETYGVKTPEKHAWMLRQLKSLTEWHVERCSPYRNMLEAMSINVNQIESLDQLPFLPVRLFKNMELKSVPESEISRILTSSGTTGSNVARVVLDAETARRQSVALAQIVGAFIGKKRLPMLIIDSPSQALGGGMLSARGAGILGLSLFGRDHQYAMKDDMTLDVECVKYFSNNYGTQGPTLLFGFTFVVWQHFYQELKKHGIRFSWEDAILIHSGGWKKMESLGVPPEEFAAKLEEQIGIRRIYNFYGMAEQVGSIYMTCEQGRFHAPVFADVIVRNEADWCPVPDGRPGLIQTVSVLPVSYPGHSILTEDIGMITGVDDCPCGRMGTTLSIIGRLPRSELRGCSDVIAANSETKET